MKVLLVTIPPIEVIRPPAILAILGSCCKHLDIEYDVMDLNLATYKTLSHEDSFNLANDLQLGHFSSEKNKLNFEQTIDLLVDKINLYQPDMVALSVFTYINQYAAEIVLSRIKQIKKHFQVAVGGLGIDYSYLKNPTKGNFSDYCLDQGLVDYYILGDGEIAFMELLKGNFLFPGINQKNNQQITNLNDLPIPTYEKINVHEYYYHTEPNILVTGSKGCVRSCTFCNVDNYWSKYIYKNGKRMAEELYHVYKTTGIQSFEFTDSLINGSITEFREFNKQLIELKNLDSNFKPKYRGQFICRPKNQFKHSDYELMYLAGVDTLIVGIESFSNSVRDHMKKKFSNDDIDNHFEQCAKYNIQNSLLLLSGYPTETLQDHRETLFYLKKYQVYALSRIIYNVSVESGGLELLPESGVPLNNMEHNLQIRYDYSNNHTQSSFVKPGQKWISLSNPSLTFKERLRRSAEIILTAINLGYHVRNLYTHIDYLDRASIPYVTQNLDPVM